MGSGSSTYRPIAPELQPAETLWTLVDEPIVNSFVPNLDKLIDTITERCSNLTTRQPEISSRTNFAWWPKNPGPGLISRIWYNVLCGPFFLGIR